MALRRLEDVGGELGGLGRLEQLLESGTIVAERIKRSAE